MMLHVYTTKVQPLTRYKVDFGDRVMTFECSPRALYWCERCRRRRWASKLHIQVYYDGSRIFCVEPCKRHKRGVR